MYLSSTPFMTMLHNVIPIISCTVGIGYIQNIKVPWEDGRKGRTWGDPCFVIYKYSFTDIRRRHNYVNNVCYTSTRMGQQLLRMCWSGTRFFNSFTCTDKHHYLALRSVSSHLYLIVVSGQTWVFNVYNILPFCVWSRSFHCSEILWMRAMDDMATGSSTISIELG